MRAVPKAVLGVVVAAINDMANGHTDSSKGVGCPTIWAMAGALSLGLVVFSSVAAVLPENRADVMYHSYQGGGVKAHGPALLLREGVGDKASLAASYYADSVSGASIDVVTTASPYKDKRDEYGLSGDYLYRDSVLSFNYTTSKESDYLADTYSFNVAQELFGGLTTVNLGYSSGHDTVLRNTDATFEATLDRYQYRVGVSQIITKSLIMSLNYEAVADDGYLNNPYRSVLLTGGTTLGEKYPTTRDSHALAWRVVKGLDLFDKQELRSAIKFDYRYFWDTWDITAHTTEFGYQQYFGKPWLADWHIRYYSQTKAVFYGDSFPVEFAYMARDKELSSYSSLSLGAKLTFRFVDRPTFKVAQGLAFDYLKFNYDDFTDVRTGELYSFNAKTLQWFVSFWY